MKKHVALFIVALLALSVVSAAGVVTAGKPTTPKLATPLLQTPADKTVIVDPKTAVTFSWSSVKGATSYAVAIERQTSDGTWAPLVQGSPSSTSYTYTFNAYAGTFRWHVMAQGHGVKASAWSDYRALQVGLATPQLITPTDGQYFTSGQDVMLSWSPVTGASSYLIHLVINPGTSYSEEHYYQFPSSFTSYWFVTSVGGGHPVKWEVQASNTDPNSPFDGATSAWSESWAFTY